MAARSTTTKKPTRKARPAKKLVKGEADQIRSWQDDPGSPESAAEPVESTVPDPGRGTLPVVITEARPKAALYDVGTAEFRYWAAAEALQRSARMWATLVPAGTTWYPSNGPELPVTLDEGEDLNAYYNRGGLHFFHASAGSRVVYSGESPDICAHELGHAVLDSLRPQLWDASFLEAGAFHESFGDVSALLAGLQLPSVRTAVLAETAGQLYRTSRLSRVAEQLGWAIRQVRPEVVDPDCLRNAVNSFFYQNPSTLPPMGPASTLSSEPHNFSRVFTGGFLEALAGMHALQEIPGTDGLLQASLDAGALLVDAIVSSPLVPAYFSQIAAHVVEADATRFAGRYAEALKGAFLRHGILSLDSGNDMVRSPTGPPVVRALGLFDREGAERQPLVSLPGRRYGLEEDLLVPALAETKRFSVVGSAPDLGGIESPSQDQAVRSFVEDLFRRDRVEVTAPQDPRRAAHRSHAVHRGPEGLVLLRTSVDCGFDVFR